MRWIRWLDGVIIDDLHETGISWHFMLAILAFERENANHDELHGEEKHGHPLAQASGQMFHLDFGHLSGFRVPESLGPEINLFWIDTKIV